MIGSTTKTDYHGRHIGEEAMSQIQPGASQAEVLELFGEPSNRSSYENSAELWSWRYTRHTKSTGSVLLLLGSSSETTEHGTVYVRMEGGRVSKIWRTET